MRKFCFLRCVFGECAPARRFPGVFLTNARPRDAFLAHFWTYRVCATLFSACFWRTRARAMLSSRIFEHIAFAQRFPRRVFDECAPARCFPRVFLDISRLRNAFLGVFLANARPCDAFPAYFWTYRACVTLPAACFRQERAAGGFYGRDAEAVRGVGRSGAEHELFLPACAFFA